MKKYFRSLFRLALFTFLMAVLFFILLNLLVKPSNERDWNIDQAILPSAEIVGDSVKIYNIRNFYYASTTSYRPSYYDKTFDLNKLKRVWYVVEPFSGIPGSAHTFLSFEFEDSQFVAISVEIRKEKGEDYHPLKGLFNKYELMYVIADEQDVVKLRSNYRQDLVYLYPARANKEQIKSLFLSMLQRANYLRGNPEFYNTMTNTCTTNIVKHINEITHNKISFFDPRVYFPAYSDQLAYRLGLIDTNLSFTETRAKFLINERALKYADSPNFSEKIRLSK